MTGKMAKIFREKLKAKRPGLQQRIGYPSNLKLQTPQELVMSMKWILNNFIDRFEDPEINKCEWYDFIWYTFRALRRKVTQFQLIDLDAVYMLEICTRFHIFSVHSMCGLEEHGFVEQLNFENLSRCLITLNHLYNDLNLREIYCANEAEFRSYHALFFHNSDLQRNVFKLDPVMRQTPNLQFALECILALNSTNYIRFFNLVREADYLTACLLYKQFHDVRYKAFMVLNKSHKPSDYRKDELIKHLGFEDVLDLDRFCDYMGIEYQPVHVNFDPKNNLFHNRRRPKNILCRLLIESKRPGIPLSEIIAGGKFVFDENELDSMGPERSDYSFNTDDDVVYEDELVPARRCAERIVAEQIWKSIFFCVVGERIEDTYERLYPSSESFEINKPGTPDNEDGFETPRNYILEPRMQLNGTTKSVFAPMAKIKENWRKQADTITTKTATENGQSSDYPKDTNGFINDDIEESSKSNKEEVTEAKGVFYENITEESSQETIQGINDSVSEATEQTTASENVNESTGEIVAEAQSSSSFENADLKPPVGADSGPAATDNCNRDNPEFEARALASIMNSVLRVVRKRGGKR